MGHLRILNETDVIAPENDGRPAIGRRAAR
jgi:hypothetical protein